MTIKAVNWHMMAFSLLFIFGCGGGGGSGGGAGNSIVTVLVKSAGVAGPLYGVQFKIVLPAGVTLSTVANGDLAAGVLKTSGGAVGAQVTANYQMTTSPQTLAVSVTSSPDGPGFAVGEFLEVSSVVAAGSSVSLAANTIAEFTGFDSKGLTINGVTGSWSAK